MVTFLVLGFVFAVAAIVYVWNGSVSGSEFDAVNWTTRDFRFLRDPFSDVQLTNVKHANVGGFTVDAAIAPHIAGGPARPVHSRWDLIQIHRGSSSGQGQAHILLMYLQAIDNQRKNYWADWTTNHPKAAPVLWGAVRDAVHLERYDRLPEIFDQARVEDDATALKEALAPIMLRLALDDAREQAKAGEQAAARLAAEVGLSYGESDELRSLADKGQEAQ